MSAPFSWPRSEAELNVCPPLAFSTEFLVQMHWRDHAPPHVHGTYQGFEALVAIANGEIIGGRLPPNAMRIVREWVLLRKAELMDNWQRGRNREPFERVAGPDEEE